MTAKDVPRWCKNCERYLPRSRFHDKRDAYCAQCLEESYGHPWVSWRDDLTEDEAQTVLEIAKSSSTLIHAALDVRRAILEMQGGGCGVCGSAVDGLVLDHDHDTGMVRGLLCHSCNSLANYRRSPEVLHQMIHYLEHPPAGSLNLRYSQIAPSLNKARGRRIS